MSMFIKTELDLKKLIMLRTLEASDDNLVQNKSTFFFQVIKTTQEKGRSKTGQKNKVEIAINNNDIPSTLLIKVLNICNHWREVKSEPLETEAEIKTVPPGYISIPGLSEMLDALDEGFGCEEPLFDTLRSLLKKIQEGELDSSSMASQDVHEYLTPSSELISPDKREIHAAAKVARILHYELLSSSSFSSTASSDLYCIHGSVIHCLMTLMVEGQPNAVSRLLNWMSYLMDRQRSKKEIQEALMSGGITVLKDMPSLNLSQRHRNLFETTVRLMREHFRPLEEKSNVVKPEPAPLMDPELAQLLHYLHDASRPTLHNVILWIRVVTSPQTSSGELLRNLSIDSSDLMDAAVAHHLKIKEKVLTIIKMFREHYLGQEDD